MTAIWAPSPCPAAAAAIQPPPHLLLLGSHWAPTLRNKIRQALLPPPFPEAEKAQGQGARGAEDIFSGLTPIRDFISHHGLCLSMLNVLYPLPPTPSHSSEPLALCFLQGCPAMIPSCPQRPLNPGLSRLRFSCGSLYSQAPCRLSMGSFLAESTGHDP
jgi:hypothetical protein